MFLPIPPMNRFRPSPASGFSIPEVMVSALLLAMVVANSAQIYFRSGNNVSSSALRDSVYGQIAADLEVLRAHSWRWACKPDKGCLSDTNPGQQVDYFTADTPGQEPYASACSNNTLASTMQAQYSASTNTAERQIFTNKVLDLPLDQATQITNQANLLYLYRSKLRIQRTVSIDSADQNSFRLNYKTINPSSSTSAPAVKVEVNTTLVPQAAGWCP